MQKEHLQAIYQTHHQKRGRYGYLFCHGERAPFIKEWIGTEKKVLDLGCRDGMLTRSFVEGNEVTGVDIDQKALEIVQKELKIKTVWLDLNGEWPFAPESYDVIVACEILEHMFFMDSFLTNIRRTLKPGGVFIGSVPNAFRLRNRFKFIRGKEFDTDPTHVRIFSWHKLQHVLGEFFSFVELVPIRGKIMPFLPVSPSIPVAISRLFAKDLLWRAVQKS
ncbi:MAG: class I SAM-dependent methyltransferase [Chlamydiales bacterium]|nr:class I SAM-dependent methyltransferase [Chlamydiales bacterium]